MRRRTALVVLWLALGGCSLTRAVRPLGAGRAAVGASVGGPLFTNLEVPLPMPLTSVYGRYGLDADTDLDVGVHLPIVRATGVDVGISRLVLTPRGARPALMAGVRLTAMGNARVGQRGTRGERIALDLRPFEEASLTASYAVGHWLLYGGLDAFLQLERGMLRPSASVGASFRGNYPLALALEARWLAFTSRGDRLTARYVTLGGYGAVGVQLGLAYHFGGGSA